MHDRIQRRYEVVRLVKVEQASVTEAVKRFDFASRSNYYPLAKLLREEGFVGLFDLRPLCSEYNAKKIQSEQGRNICVFPKDKHGRPLVSIWPKQVGVWHNAFHGLNRQNYDRFVQIVKSFAEGVGVRAIGRIFSVDTNSVLNYLRRASHQCRRVSESLIRDMTVEELQLDEMWSFVEKKEKNLTELEYCSQQKGDQWCWVAFDVRSKVIVQYEIGRRTYRLAKDLIRNFALRTAGHIPLLITTDDYPGYTVALLEVYGIGGPGEKSLPPDMDYVVVAKKRKAGRVVDIKIKVVNGDMQRIETKLEQSPVSNSPNVAFVERCHLSRRIFNRRLTRKTLGFSKKLENHLCHYELETTIHNFVRPHRGLKGNTPMIAAGKTDHSWSIEELLSYTGN